MSKSLASQGMDDIQQKLALSLKEWKFLVRSRTYNRQTAEGLIHVIEFQMGRFDLPGAVHIPSFRERKYGKFTANVGVFFPEVAMIRGRKVGKFVGTGLCSINVRLGFLGPDRKDIWWDIPDKDDSKQRLAEELKGRLQRDVFPFFARFETRDAFLKEVLGPTGKSYRAHVDSAIILAVRGQLKEAREVLTEYRDDHIRRGGHLGHLDYLEELAAKIGIDGWKEA